MNHLEYQTKINNINKVINDLNEQKQSLTTQYHISVLEYNGYHIGDTVKDKYNHKHVIDGVVNFGGIYYIKTKDNYLDIQLKSL